MSVKITDKEFITKITKQFKKFKIPEKKQTFNQICYPKSYNLQVPQEFLSNFINPHTQYKDILIYHKIGAGKTCSAIRIAEEWKHKRDIVVVLPAALINNFKKEILSQCTGTEYISKKQREILNSLHPTDKEYLNIIDDAYKKIDKYYTIYSYNKFLDNIKNIKLKNSILIVDEVQNMVSEDGIYYVTLYNAIHKAPNDLRVILMSATPMFDKPVEFALTMNLLRLPEELPVGREFIDTFIEQKNNKFYVKNLDKFKQMIKGYVSYYSGAPDYVYPKMTVKYIRCEMSKFQYNAYKTVKNADDVKYKKIMDISTLPNTFFIGTRYVSNVVFPNGKINERGFNSFTGNKASSKIKKYSCKFDKIIKKLKSSTGKVFIYSGFKEYGGLKSLIHVLEQSGFKNYKDHGEGHNRFAVWSSDENDKYKEEIKNIYNMTDNLKGSKLRIILGSPSIKEGVSLTAVRQVHILEPYWNKQRLAQVIGRASRFCSHKDLEKEKRTVKVYIYLATHPDEKETVDEYIYELSKQKNNIIEQFEHAIKEAAIDCELFKAANNINKDIKCLK